MLDIKEIESQPTLVWVQGGAVGGKTMGCVASSEEEKPKAPPATLAEREADARTKRKEAASLVHNLVQEKFGR